MTANIRIGCSGWSYKHWLDDFYEARTPNHRLLSHYSTVFKAVEINTSFYGMPKPEQVSEWQAQTPDDFSFSWKAHKYITHMKLLRGDLRDGIHRTLLSYKRLGHKAGPIVFQLPPRLSRDTSRLRNFLEQWKEATATTSQHIRVVFEFRHPTWYCDPTYQLLSDYDVALCWSDHRDAPSPHKITAGFIYARLHGPEGDYKGRYQTSYLEAFAQRIQQLRERQYPAYIFFDNDGGCAAPKDALALQHLLRQQHQQQLSAVAK